MMGGMSACALRWAAVNNGTYTVLPHLIRVPNSARRPVSSRSVCLSADCPFYIYSALVGFEYLISVANAL